MKLSVVLLTWNSLPFIPDCVNSLKQDVPTESELIVVDNGSTDGSKEYLRQHHPDIHIIENSCNRGVGPARNQGIRIAEGEYILVLDIDTVVLPGSIPSLLGVFELDDRIGVAGAKLLSKDRELQYTCRRFPTVLSKITRQFPPTIQDRLLRREEYRDWDHGEPRFVGYIIGACQMISRKARDQVGLYDERIFYGPEDVDYCLRMWQEGWRVVYVPDAEILHLERRITRRQVLNNPILKKHLNGLVVYFRKHGYLFRAPRFEEIDTFVDLS